MSSEIAYQLGYHPIKGLKGAPRGNLPGPAPRPVQLAMAQLVINEDYQRGVSDKGIKLILGMAAAWDWGAYKAPTVCPTDEPDIYEVVDGQHTAIAAATNGNIPFLPCLIHDLATLADKARGFIGINTRRIQLTALDIYSAQVAAQDPAAIDLECALVATGCRLLAHPRSEYRPGDTVAIKTLLALAGRGGQARVERVLRICLAVGSMPIASSLIKALDVVLPHAADADVDRKVVDYLILRGVFEEESHARVATPKGGRSYETFADRISSGIGLRQRLGLEKKK